MGRGVITVTGRGAFGHRSMEQEWELAIGQAVEEDKAGGLYYSHEAMGAWIDSLLEGEEKAIEPDVFLPPER